ncbi:hypothetical protein JTE90_003843, partial [Oedothorax gibbosus]
LIWGTVPVSWVCWGYGLQRASLTSRFSRVARPPCRAALAGKFFGGKGGYFCRAGWGGAYLHKRRKETNRDSLSNASEHGRSPRPNPPLARAWDVRLGVSRAETGLCSKSPYRGCCPRVGARPIAARFYPMQSLEFGLLEVATLIGGKLHLKLKYFPETDSNTYREGSAKNL